MPSGYYDRVFDTVEAVPARPWMELCRLADLGAAAQGPFMDVRFLRALEASFSDGTRFWAVVIYDECDRPAACAWLTLFRVDGTVLAGGWGKRLTDGIRRRLPGYLFFKVLLCGSPVSAGQSGLRIRPDADGRKVAQALDRVLCRLARKHGARILAVKEFDAADAERMAPLGKHGFLRAESLPMNAFEPRFASFDEARAAMKAHYRAHFKKSERKFADAGLRMETTTDPERIAQVYTPHVHRLYQAVEGQAAHRFERLPHPFFHALTRQFPGQVSLTLAWRGDEVVGFDWGLLDRGVFCNLFVGIDYAINAETDLYFNLMMHNLDHGLRQSPSAIFVGQSADQFKSRLGCHQEPRYFFVKARGWLLGCAMHLFRGLLFPPAPAPHARRELFGEGRASPSASDKGLQSAGRPN